MGGGDRDLTTLEAAAMEGRDLNLKMEAVAICEGDRDLKTKMTGVSGSERRKPWEEEGAILKLKKEVLTAMDLWFHKERMARNGVQEKAQQQALGARKKKMKVVKTKFSKGFIDHMVASPLTVCNDLSDEELAQHDPCMREVYAAIKIYEAKRREYWNVLAAQQKEMGYAEDEIEVIDEEEEAVVKKLVHEAKGCSIIY